MENVGLGIAAASGLAIAVIGVLYLARPHMIAAAFGLPSVPSERNTPWLRLKGIRDLAAGVVAAVLLIAATPEVVGWVLIAFALIPSGDMATVLAAKGRASAAWGIHGATALVLLVGATLILVGS